MRRPPTIAAELRLLVSYLDHVDQIMGLTGRGVQLDLDSLATWMEDHPETDAEIYGTLVPE